MKTIFKVILIISIIFIFPDITAVSDKSDHQALNSLSSSHQSFPSYQEISTNIDTPKDILNQTKPKDLTRLKVELELLVHQQNADEATQKEIELIKVHSKTLGKCFRDVLNQNFNKAECKPVLKFFFDEKEIDSYDNIQSLKGIQCHKLEISTRAGAIPTESHIGLQADMTMPMSQSKVIQSLSEYCAMVIFAQVLSTNLSGDANKIDDDVVLKKFNVSMESEKPTTE
jgi:hypothetical protein